MLEINKIHCGDAKHLMMDLDRESVDVCMTSPPYWGLRNYDIKEQIGQEEHPQEYINKLVKIFGTMKKALKKTGSFYLNLGDTYASVGSERYDKKNYGGLGEKQVDTRILGRGRIKERSNWLQPKQLLLIPPRVAIALQEDGWILRNTIIWHKPNAMPESVEDRFTTDFEYLFFFVKNKRYYFEKQLEPLQESTKQRVNYPRCKEDSKGTSGQYAISSTQYGDYSNGRNKRAVWQISTRNFSGAHFAIFPPELIITPLKSSCPDNGIVLDPFGGSGTVAYVCKYAGKFGINKRLNYVLFEINPTYIKMANKRLSQETLLALTEIQEGDGGT